MRVCVGGSGAYALFVVMFVAVHVQVIFKSPTRLECMMQDLPGLMPAHLKVAHPIPMPCQPHIRHLRLPRRPPRPLICRVACPALAPRLPHMRRGGLAPHDPRPSTCLNCLNLPNPHTHLAPPDARRCGSTRTRAGGLHRGRALALFLGRQEQPRRRSCQGRGRCHPHAYYYYYYGIPDKAAAKAAGSACLAPITALRFRWLRFRQV